jgi:hypothetical protein
MSDSEVARDIAARLRVWRVDPRGAGLSQVALARRSGVGVTPLKRFEKTGGATLGNLIGILRGLGILDRLETLVPDPASPSPMELLEAARKVKPPRQRAPGTRGRASATRGTRHG